MRVVVLCATRRGYRCLEKLTALLPKGSLAVFSFREEPWEPPFIEDIRSLALDAGGVFFETTQVGQAQFAKFWEAPIDLMLVVSWRYKIPSHVYLRSRQGTYVFHDSLLPQYRGFAPTVWAIVNGETQTGVSLFAITEDVDAGDIVDQRAIAIPPDSTIAEVMERVTETYVELLEANLQRMLDGNVPLRGQDQSRATFTCKRTPLDNEIDWSLSTTGIYNLIRACSAPYPGAYTYLDGKKLMIWSAALSSNEPRYVGRIPGRVVDIRQREGSMVLTGNGSILVRQVQVEGGDIVCAAEILNRLSQTLGRK